MKEYDNIKNYLKDTIGEKNKFSSLDIATLKDNAQRMTEKFDSLKIRMRREWRDALRSTAYSEEDKKRGDIAELLIIFEGCMFCAFGEEVDYLDNDKLEDIIKYNLWNEILLSVDKLCEATKKEFNKRGFTVRPEVREEVFKSMVESHAELFSNLKDNEIIKFLPEETQVDLPKVINQIQELHPSFLAHERKTEIKPEEQKVSTKESIREVDVTPKQDAMQQNRITELRNLIVKHFNMKELKDLCFELPELEYEDLPGQTISEKARELVQYMERHNRIAELIKKAYEKRQHVNELKNMLQVHTKNKIIDQEINKMIDIETKAVNTLNILSDFIEKILASGKFKNIYSEDFGNLEKRIVQNRNFLEVNLKLYKEKQDLNEQFRGTFETEYTKATMGLNTTLEEINIFWIREILPRMKEDLNSIPEKIEEGEIEVKEEKKRDFLDNVDKTLGTLEKIMTSGKKVWEFVKEHKEIFLSVGRLFTWLI